MPRGNIPRKVKECDKEQARKMQTQEAIKGHGSLLPIYKNSSYPRGKCLIISNQYLGKKYELPGTKKDGERLKALFEELDYVVTLKMELTSEQVMEEIKSFSSSHDHSDSAFIYLTGHGDNIDGDDVFIGTDRVGISTEWIHETFGRAEYLRARPKFVIFDCCRGGERDKPVRIVQRKTKDEQGEYNVEKEGKKWRKKEEERRKAEEKQRRKELKKREKLTTKGKKFWGTSDRKEEAKHHPPISDMLVFVSTLPGRVSYGRSIGGLFTTTFIDVISNYAHKLPKPKSYEFPKKAKDEEDDEYEDYQFRNLLTRVSNEVSNSIITKSSLIPFSSTQFVQQPQIKNDSMRGKFYFFPKFYV